MLRYMQKVMEITGWRWKAKHSRFHAKWENEAPRAWFSDPDTNKYARSELAWWANAGDPDNGVGPTGVDFVWVRLNFAPDPILLTHMADYSAPRNAFRMACTKSSSKESRSSRKTSRKRTNTTKSSP
jgi:hypothetical protein